jgi:hypothetical protein
VGDIARHDDGAVQRQTGGDRVGGQLRQDLAHRLIEINADHFAFTLLTQRFRDVLARVALQFFNPDTVAVDFGFDIAVSGAGDAHADRAGGAVARQANHADIVGEVFAAELRAEAEILRFQQQLLLQLNIAERLAVLVTFGRQAVVVAVEASLTVFSVASAEVPPITKAIWYGGQAAVPRVRIFSTR